MRALDKSARASDILVRNIDYSIFFEKNIKRNRFTLVVRVRLAKTSIWAQIADVKSMLDKKH